MPDLRSLGLDVNPSAHPLRYPGALVTRSCLVTGSWLYPLHPAPGERIGSWDVDLAEGSRGPTRLDDVLRATGVAEMEDRYPVLAVGSNAAPAQLRHKFAAAPDVSDMVPLVRADVRGLAVGHSAHVSKAGYVPYVPLAGGREAACRLFVLWLDADQLRCIDATEPNYHPTLVSGELFPIRLESGATLARYSLYRGRWGALKLAPQAPALPATEQDVVYRELGQLAWFDRLVPESRDGVDATVRALGADERRRLAVRDALVREGLAADDGLSRHDGCPVPYREL